MSSRLVKKDNICIVGIYKNASQSVKQIAKQNEGWEIYEDHFKEAIDFNDSNLKVFIPVRDEWERHESALIQDLSLLFKHTVPSDEEIEQAIVQLKKIRFNVTSFDNHPDHFTNNIGECFLKDIFLNDDWKGMQVYYFDLNYFSSHLADYLNLDIKIPHNNKAEDLEMKVRIRNRLRNEWKNEHIKKVAQSFYTLEKINCRNFIWNQIKKTKHWINFN